MGVDGGGVTQATIGNLIPYTRYTIVLQAFNSRGAGPTSPPIVAITSQDRKLKQLNLIEFEIICRYMVKYLKYFH